MNGYFRLKSNEKGTSLILVPPVDGGEKILLNELKWYLDTAGVPYDVTAITSALHKVQNEAVAVFLNSERIMPINEQAQIIISPDKLSAFMRLYPACGGNLIEKSSIMKLMKKYGIVYGVDEAAIDGALANKEYCTDYIVARGRTATAGKDAVVEYMFDTNTSARPELKPDGSVDFFKLNTLHHCTKGQVLARIIPEEKGEDGFDVLGRRYPAREVKKAKFAHGRNLEISEDGLELRSMVDGHASLVEGTVFVSDVYSVENVSIATGNIEYHGNVEVKGNVCENFHVKTDGDVFVNGVVEGAEIEAGGNIVIARGMHGQNKGKLKAGGNIIAKFISAAEVSADGFVEAEQIINAKINAGDCVHAEAGKGLITGGKVVAKRAVTVKNAGSPMGASTIIEVGCDPEAKRRLSELQKSVGEKSKAVSQMKKGIEVSMTKLKSGEKLTGDQLKNIKILQTTLAENQKQLQEDLKEIEILDKALRGSDNSHIDIRGTMYQGCSVGISGASMKVKSEYTFCRLIKKGADVVSTNL